LVKVPKVKQAATHFQILVYNHDQLNLALFQPVRASSEVSAATAKTNAVDGNPDTKWQSRKTDGQWIQVELDQLRAIGKIDIHWGADYAPVYEILASGDGLNWSLVFKEENGDGGSDEIELNQVEAMYIRVFGKYSNSGNGIGIHELGVYQKNVNVTAIGVFEPKGLTVYPNPVQAEAEICYQVERPSKIVLNVFSVTGETVQLYSEDNHLSGLYKFPLNTNYFTAGVYWVRLTTNNSHSVAPFVVN
jgi:hypothetical protein